VAAHLACHASAIRHRPLKSTFDANAARGDEALREAS